MCRFCVRDAHHAPALFAAAHQSDLSEQEKVARDAGLGVRLAPADCDGIGGQELARFTLALGDPHLDQEVDRGQALAIELARVQGHGRCTLKHLFQRRLRQ